MPSTKTTLPPVDTAGEMAEANKLLRRFRTALEASEKLTPEWCEWVATSLLAGVKVTEETEL